MVAQFIFTMRDLRRYYPPDREVLKGINLSFYPGAKIGVIGANGSGKTSLLRIMAGLDDGFTGEARLTPGFSVGYLSQEPQLDPTKDVIGNVADGIAEQRDLLRRADDAVEAAGFSEQRQPPHLRCRRAALAGRSEVAVVEAGQHDGSGAGCGRGTAGTERSG